MRKSVRTALPLLVIALLAVMAGAPSAAAQAGGGPSVTMSLVSPTAQVRIDSPLPVKAAFSEPVSGFTLDDIAVANGAAGNFSGSDGDSVYTFDVTPNNIGTVTVDIAAGVATDAGGDGNTAAPQFSLGIPYDDDRDGIISKREVIGAIRDYFSGRITKAQTIALIRLYFAGPPPGPSPATTPGAPTGLSATANGQTQIDLSWSGPSDDDGAAITGYRIEVSADRTAWSDLVGDSGSTSTTHSHTGLMHNTTVYYRVSAINSEGTSPVSDTADATTDDYPEVKVEFGSADYSVAEGGTQMVMVTLSADPEREIVIPIVATKEKGAADADYSGVPASVTFNMGDTSTSFTFTAEQDTDDDDGEKVKLSFGTMPNARVSAGTLDETTVSITDDDDPQVTVMFGQGSYSVEESDDTGTPGNMENEVEVTVDLSADPERTVIIPIVKTDQGGVSSADYSGVPADVTFSSGETSKSFTFTAEHDTIDDDNEKVKLSFGTLPSRVTVGTLDETTVSITDDDDPQVTVMFGQGSYSVEESDDTGTPGNMENEVEVTVDLSADPERTVIIPIVKTDQGGVSSTDYSGVPTDVTFNSGETSKTFTFTATDDDEDDDGEKVKLTFGTFPSRVSAGNPG